MKAISDLFWRRMLPALFTRVLPAFLGVVGAFAATDFQPFFKAFCEASQWNP